MKMEYKKTDTACEVSSHGNRLTVKQFNQPELNESVFQQITFGTSSFFGNQCFKS